MLNRKFQVKRDEMWQTSGTVYIYSFRLYLLDKNHYLDNLTKLNVDEKYNTGIVSMKRTHKSVFRLYL